MNVTWWVLRADHEYVAAATYGDKAGLKLRWSDDYARALRLPTARAAQALRRAWRFPGEDAPSLRVFRVTRRTVHRLPAAEGSAS